MEQATEIVLEYEPRELFVPFHQRHQRWAAMVWHRRAGKTVACVNDLIAKALYTRKPNARYAYIAPFYRQAKDVAWQYLKQFAAPVIKGRPRESELRVELINGSWITLYGADNPDALRGLYLDGVIIDEFGDCRPSLWSQVILPTLVDRKGWAVFIGTPKGKNEFYRVFQRSQKEKGWYSAFMPASKTGLIAAEELEEMRRQMSDEKYDQEMECSFDAALPGTYFAKYIQAAEADGRITPLEYDPNRPVLVGSDLGRRDSTVLVFAQEFADGLQIIDVEENHGEDAEYYVDLCLTKPWRDNYDTIWLPHDGRSKTLATKRSVFEQFRDAGLPARIAPKLSEQDGIEAVRMFLPWCWFNSMCPRMEQALDALRSYRRKFDELKQRFLDHPDHDWSSHTVKAMETLSIVAHGGKNFTRRKKDDPRILTPGTPTYEFTLDNLFADNERPKNWNTLRI